MNRLAQIFLAATLIAMLPSCSTTTCELDLSEHPELPSARLTHAMRHIIVKSQFLRERAIWGNYGGPGCTGGRPIDQMDEWFRQHDLAYLQGVKRKELIAADKVLISQLETLEPEHLSSQADAYRRRAIRYFRRPISRVIGKPPDVLFGWKDSPVVIDTSIKTGSPELPQLPGGTNRNGQREQAENSK